MKLFGKELKFNNNKVYHAGDKPTASEIGAAASSHTHNYAGSSSAGGAATSALACTGNAATATKLAKSVTINGVAFDGSSNITISASSSGGNSSTATKLQTARTLTVGNTGKSFDGSANVSWSLSEIGAAASSHTHNYAGSASAGGAANSATVLATARTINGTSFNGSANITTANWGTARTLTVGNSGKSVNGSANVSWSLNEIGATPGSTISGTTAATAQWYRIAQTTSTDQANTIGKFMIRAAVSGKHSSTIITAGITYGQNPTLNQLSHTQYSGVGLTKARIVYHTTYSGNRAYLEVYVPDATARTIDVQLEGSLGWTLVAPSTVGSIPSGYTSTEITFAANRIVANITGALSGNATTATTLQTARTINGTSFNGSANITTANWGTARTLTIGSTGKSVNGSANVSWTLAEIGAAAASHTHNYAGSSSAGGAATTALACTGNSATATKLATARTITATGHATGSVSFDGSANASLALTLANSGVTAASYGPTGNSSPASGGTFTVPQVTVDAKGRVTSAATRTITLPKSTSVNYYYSETAPASANENDIWYKTEVGTSATPTHTFNYTGAVQQFSAPIDGVYKIACYGARGGYRNYSSTSYAGKGGLVSGNVTLKKGDTLYIYVGQNGNISSTASYSFNGGGKGSASYQYGGGASDVRLVGGNWDNEASLLSRIIVAGGGGSCGGNTKTGGNSDTSASSGYGTGGQAGSQTAGGTGSSTNTTTKGSFGKGGYGINANSGYGGAGGGGWYGGAGTYPDSSGDDDKGGGGGSNYVYTSSSTKPSGYTPDARFQFTNTSIATTNTVTDGKVEIYSAINGIAGTYVYRNGAWQATASKVDSDALMNTETYSKLSTTNKTIVGAINEVFQSVSSGKSSIAQAITSKGVSASASDTFSSLATKIKNIQVKKYDTGETLKKGTNFEFATSFAADDFHSRYPNVNGSVYLSSSEILMTEISYSSYGIYYYSKSEDKFQLATSLYGSEGMIGIVGQYGVISSLSNTGQDLVQIGYLNSPPSIPDASIIPGYTKDMQKNYFYEYNGVIYLLAVSICNTSSSSGGIPMPPCVMAQLYKFNGSSFVEADTSGYPVTLYPSTGGDLTMLEFKFTVSENYFAIAHAPDTYSDYTIEVFSRSTYSPEFTADASRDLEAFCFVGNYLFYSEDDYVRMTDGYYSSSTYLDYGAKVAVPYDGKVLYVPGQTYAYCPTVDSYNSLYQILKIDVSSRSFTTESMPSRSEPGVIIANKRYTNFGQVEDYSTIILK